MFIDVRLLRLRSFGLEIMFKSAILLVETFKLSFVLFFAAQFCLLTHRIKYTHTFIFYTDSLQYCNYQTVA